MRDDLEFRATIELRAVAGRKLAGHAAVFGISADIGGKFRETIRAGAFSATLRTGGDVCALVDHDPCRLLARTSSGTLRLSEDTRGLSFEIDLPDTTLGRDMMTLAGRGDLGGMSIGFRAIDETWPNQNTRELRAIELIEVSIAQAWPAYSGTEIALRHRGTARITALSPLLRARLLDLI